MAGSGCALRRSSTRRITQRKASFEEMPLEVPASASSPPYDKVRLPGQSFGEAGMQPDFLRRFRSELPKEKRPLRKCRWRFQRPPQARRMTKYGCLVRVSERPGCSQTFSGDSDRNYPKKSVL